MFGVEIHRVVKSLARVSKMEWRYIIYIRRDQGVWIRKKVLFVG